MRPGQPRMFGIVWVLLLHVVIGAKRELFKTCDQLGFCHRNKNYSPIKNNYHITEFYIDHAKNAIVGQITKALPTESLQLPFELAILENGGIHFTLDELRPNISINSTRFSPAYLYNLVHRDISTVSVTNSTISFEGIDVVIHNEFKIQVFVNGTLTLTINHDNLLNVEHYRPRNALNQLNQGENDYNMFEDTFKDSRGDTLPLGPESVAVDFTFHRHHHLYGIPEHSDSLELKDQMYRLFNVDIFEYEINSTLPMYGSIPFLLAPGDNCLGLFWINAADTFIDISHAPHGRRTHWGSENGKLEFVVLIGNTPGEVNKKYGQITGFTSLPQLFSLGYHQCRWNYNDDKDVLTVIDMFDEHQIPIDLIWLDIEYTEAKKYFTWNLNFHPQQLLPTLDQTGRNLVVIVDPHIKTGFSVSDHLISNKLTIMDSTNQPFKGHCWPGESVWVDSLNPHCQEYWDQLHELANNGFLTNNTNIHLWNDMNEISVFDGPETTSPKDNLHYGLLEDRSVHNLNGLMFHNLTYNSLIHRLASSSRQRPFILTRSFFAGSQKTAAMWTGDNMLKWEYLKLLIPMVINNGLAGMPFGGADVGGFFGDPSPELLTRWYQVGVFYPFFRAHAHIDSRRREPWVPGEPFTGHIKDAIRLRYKLLPEFYTAFKAASETGTPILKPMFYDHAGNYHVQDQFYLGNSGILVKPVTEPQQQSTTIVMPGNTVYYNFTNGIPSGDPITDHINIDTGLDTIPMVLEAGHIIYTKQRYRRSSRLMANDPYTMIVALDNNGNALGRLYIDDGESFDFVDGKFLDIVYRAAILGSELTITSSNVHDGFDNKKIDKVIVLGVDHVRSVLLDGTPSQFSASPHKLEIKVNKNVGWKIRVSLDLVHDEL